MPPTTIHTAPDLASFTPLDDHQAQTPTTFFGTRPVLHYHVKDGRAVSRSADSRKLLIFPAHSNAQSTSQTDTDSSVLAAIDVFVDSENLTLFNSSSSIGITIPYPSIALHAIQRLPDPADTTREVQGLYMQLELSDPAEEDDEDEPQALELTLLPSVSTTPDINTSEADVQALFTAVSNCSNLHPDPMQENDDDEMEDGDSRIMFEGSVGYQGISGLPGSFVGTHDGGLPPPFPGSTGWITAENVEEYFDADGNWIGGENEEPLGEGAGRVRARDEVDSADAYVETRINGHGRNGDDEDEHKRTRTE